MTVFKCKMCGANLNVKEGETVCECEFCGTKQTLPRLSSEKKINLYDRANHMRRNNDYDKAMSIYEQILNEDRTDSEAYWSILLCRYGIEYVKDPKSGVQIPTVNRAQYTSIFADEDYKSAIEYADISQKQIYEKEAKKIDEIQRGILEISNKEEPFDVFICYKETDRDGRRTQDSVLAQEIYYGLKNEGLKVFFSRITLEDKLGTEYEPYIFAALNSSKVMVVLGTTPEYLNAVWVRNEWSRYLSLIKNGAKKTLIPAYKDMDPYDLPEDFSHLQALDMSKLGFMQDLTRGIKKIIGYTTKTEKESPTTAKNDKNDSIPPLLKRAYLFLEDGDFESADEYAERVLDMNPEISEPYIIKLLAELYLQNKADLENADTLIEKNTNYQKALRYATSEEFNYLNEANAKIKARLEEALKEEAYIEAENCVKKHDFERAESIYSSLGNYRDCPEKLENVKTERIYAKAKHCINNKYATLKVIENMIAQLNALPRTSRSNDLIMHLEDRRDVEIAKIKNEVRINNIKKTLTKILLYVVLPIIITVVVAVLFYNKIYLPNSYIYKGNEFSQSENYDEAISYYIKCVDTNKEDEAKEKIVKILDTLLTQNRFEEYTSLDSKYDLNRFADKSGKVNAKILEYFDSLYENKQYDEAYGLLTDFDLFDEYNRSHLICKYTSEKNYKELVKLGITDIVIPYGTEKIDSYAFSYLKNLNSVTIPETVKVIGEGAFKDCTSITEIVLPDSVSEIGISAFRNCLNLSNIKLGKGIKRVGDSAFTNCDSLKYIDFNNSVEYIGRYAFSGCKRLIEVKNISKLEKIAEYAFRECESLNTFKLPSEVTEIAENAFQSCKNLETVEFNEKIILIGAYAFVDCEKLVKLNLPKSLVKIDKYAFKNCKSLEELCLPEKTTSLGEYAFSDCINLKKAVLTESIKILGEGVFTRCNTLKEVKLPINLTELSNYMFSSCKSLESIDLPKNLEIINVGAFKNCESLKNVNFYLKLDTIENNAFYGCSSLESIKLPESLYKIETNAFSNCKNLKFAELPSSVEIIDQSNFKGRNEVIFILGPNLPNINILDLKQGENPVKIYYKGTEEEWNNAIHRLGDSIHNKYRETEVYFKYEGTKEPNKNYWKYDETTGLPKVI